MNQPDNNPDVSEFNPDFALHDKDGYCVACGNGSWKAHMPGCSIAGLLDENRELRSCDLCEQHRGE